MKKYLMLTNEEIKRSSKLYLIVVGALIVLELLSVVVKTMLYERSIETFMRMNQASELEAVNSYGTFSFAAATSIFDYIMMIGVAYIVVLALQIWYREWIGESKHIYRLLLLPGSRVSIYFAKLTTVLLVTVSLIGLQWLTVVASYGLFDWLLPESHKFPTGLISDGGLLQIFYSMNIEDVFILLMMSCAVINLLFFIVLIERTFRKTRAMIQLIAEAMILILPFGLVMYITEGPLSGLLLRIEYVTLYLVLLSIGFFYVGFRSIRLVQNKLSV